MYNWVAGEGGQGEAGNSVLQFSQVPLIPITSPLWNRPRKIKNTKWEHCAQISTCFTLTFSSDTWAKYENEQINE